MDNGNRSGYDDGPSSYPHNPVAEKKRSPAAAIEKVVWRGLQWRRDSLKRREEALKRREEALKRREALVKESQSGSGGNLDAGCVEAPKAAGWGITYVLAWLSMAGLLVLSVAYYTVLPVGRYTNQELLAVCRIAILGLIIARSFMTIIKNLRNSSWHAVSIKRKVLHGINIVLCVLLSAVVFAFTPQIAKPINQLSVCLAGNAVAEEKEADWKSVFWPVGGSGRSIHPNGLVYEGEFFGYYQYGTGVVSWPNGREYQGSVEGWRLEGDGVLTIGDLGLAYSGKFNNVPTMTGEGEFVGDVSIPGSDDSLVFADMTYVGDWVYGIPHGDGKLSFANAYYDQGDPDTLWVQRARYQGSIGSGRPHGEGKLLVETYKVIPKELRLRNSATDTGASRPDLDTLSEHSISKLHGIIHLNKLAVGNGQLSSVYVYEGGFATGAFTGSGTRTQWGWGTDSDGKPVYDESGYVVQTAPSEVITGDWNIWQPVPTGTDTPAQ
jgi:hypothetical protein